MTEWRPIETAPVNTPVLVWIDGLLMVPNVMTKDLAGAWRESAADGRVYRYPENITWWASITPPPAETSPETPAT